MNPFFIRPLELKDLDQFKDLVDSMKTGLASLPNDIHILKKKIENSQKALKAPSSQPGKEHYLFTLENIQTHQLIGICGIYARTGGNTSFYVYEINYEKFSHSPLKISKEVRVLHLKKINKGPSELCSLYLKPEFRHLGQGRLLALSRYLFIAIHKKRFSHEIIAIMRGYRNAKNKSPFWQALGKYFF